ncbi:MAG: T9SS type A sorting domain-containing protein [Bacteroidota bacterium]|nr:T9SS type A sorting domain-containing protein [Bacteroidota bacterium]
MRSPLALVLVAWTVPAFAQVPEPVTIDIRGDSVLIRNTAVNENCAARFAVDIVWKDATVTITERDTVREKMRCICSFDIDVVLTGIPAGIYTAVLEREYLVKYGYPSDMTRRIGTFTFEVKAGGAWAAFSSRQSDCHGVASVELPMNPFPPRLSVIPNPLAAPRGMIRLELADAVEGELSIVDLLGRSIVVLKSGAFIAGSQDFEFDASVFPVNGLYIAVLRAGEHAATVPFIVHR